ncbi:guanine-N(1)--methyltransferase [Xylogone sp. PMI_703]|nr:guanine-N(1)--methyltransferase [Xylogone sp. PMI_703]
MSDGEGRPSKIRKLEPPVDVHETITSLAGISPQTIDGENNQDGRESKSETAETRDTSNDAPHISKSQLKKLRRREQWEAGREYRREKRREKNKQRQARKAEERAAKEQQLASGEIDTTETEPPKEQRKYVRPIQVPVGLILDCDFNELMTEKELISLSAQITRCYSDNRGSAYRAHLAVSSWGGALKTRYETVLANHHLAWKGVRFLEQDFVDTAKELDTVMKGPDGGKLVGALDRKDIQGPHHEQSDPQSQDADESDAAPSQPSVVYLSSDSPYTIEKLEPNTSYVIGGIVDKNRHKGICYKRACERGIRTGKLPIGEYMTMQSRSVLAVNHVVEILLKWLETGDWGEAFLSVIPKRKEAKLKTKEGSGSTNNTDDLDGPGNAEGSKNDSEDEAISTEDIEDTTKANSLFLDP